MVLHSYCQSPTVMASPRASPRRARSLFLSPEKAELLAAKEINTLVRHVEIVPRKPVPRRGKRTDIVVETSRDESRMSTSSTINAVDKFCGEYRPPSVALHRLSYLDKELPPPPTEPKIPNRSLTLSTPPLQKDAAVQTAISVQIHRPPQIQAPTPRRLSTISSQQRESRDRISIRSRFSTQDDDSFHSFEPLASVPNDPQRRSDTRDSTEGYMKRGGICSISPGSEHQRSISSNCAIQRPTHEAEAEPQPLQVRQNSFRVIDTRSKEITSGMNYGRKLSVSWTFYDGFILRTKSKSEATAARDINSARGTKALIPIRWTFHDGIIYQVSGPRNNKSTASEGKSTHIFPIGWSFYDGLTMRRDGSAEPLPRSKSHSGEGANGSKFKRLVPIGWTFHEGLVFAIKAPPGNAVSPSPKEPDTRINRGLGSIPTARNDHGSLVCRKESLLQSTEQDGLGYRAEIISTSVNQPSMSGPVIKSAKQSTTDRELRSTAKSRHTISWTFNDGLTFKSKARVKANRKSIVTSSKRKRSIKWTFNDGLVIRKTGGVPELRPLSRSTANGTKPKLMPIAWTFHDGLMFRNRPTDKDKGKGIDRHLHPAMPKAEIIRRFRITYNFWDGIQFKTVDGKLNRLSVSQPHSKVTWSFHDGFARKMTYPSNQASARQVAKRTYGWTFHDGFIIRSTPQGQIPWSIEPSGQRHPSISAANPAALKSSAEIISTLDDRRISDVSLTNQSRDIVPADSSSMRFSGGGRSDCFEEHQDSPATKQLIPRSIFNVPQDCPSTKRHSLLPESISPSIDVCL